MAETIHVQVCFATPDRVILRDLNVPSGTQIEEAIRQSGLLDEVHEIDLENSKVGVFGKLRALDAVLREHDRVEIYRPLQADPKEARRMRAAKKESTQKEG